MKHFNTVSLSIDITLVSVLRAIRRARRPTIIANHVQESSIPKKENEPQMLEIFLKLEFQNLYTFKI